jgi:RNA polymerase sigma-70 factor (ECF subfamily)
MQTDEPTRDGARSHEETLVPALQTATAPRAPSAPPADLERLFREQHAAILRAAYRITGSRADAEDVLQTVFLRLLRTAEPNLLESGAGGYLYRAAVNAALDIVRTRARQGRVGLDDVAPPVAATTDDGDRRLHSRDLESGLRAALTKVSPRAAEMFVLRYIEDKPNQEIARLLGTSQGVVAVLLHRTRARVKKELAALLETRHEA